ncbi:MAG: AmmeMemoRadiSam system radical SAM enzyme [Candidatus Omnitrophota bacterium]|nr:MAG: AmmeMemoRadiSam system radical SAM enzyme [Candidatus Omnitrophota bacterium]
MSKGINSGLTEMIKNTVTSPQTQNDLFEALYYKQLDGDRVQCMLCPKQCIISKNNTGFCGVRKNISGKLYSLNYYGTTGIALDPVEKKPLYHFHSGEMVVSLGSCGCNFSCKFCQNWQISQNMRINLQRITPQQLIAQTKVLGCFGIAYTYNEPFIWYEFVLCAAKLAKNNGLENIMVTNGYINQQPLKEILPYLGAMNIDLKALDNNFYKNICQGTLEPVLETIKTVKNCCHLEVTNLIIPGLNDTDAHFVKLTDWIYTNTGEDTPLHFSRYFPCFKLKIPPTPLETLQRAYEIAKKKLKFVYLGNV